MERTRTDRIPRWIERGLVVHAERIVETSEARDPGVRQQWNGVR
jgi:hypothetical protein